MPENQLVPSVHYLENKGLILKREPGQLRTGEYSELTNVVSVQEGSLTVRAGNQNCTSSWSQSNFIQTINTITKLHTSGSTDYRYLGTTTATTYEADIWRSSSALGAGMSFTKVASNIAPSAASYIGQRFSGVRYAAGSIGTPWEFFACPSVMLKDKGDGSLSTLQNWGIVQPAAPAIATLSALTVKPSGEIHSGSARYSGSVSSVVPASGGAGYYTVTPSSMQDGTTKATIAEGMLLNVSGQLAVVEATTSTAFSAYFPSGTPTGTITSGAATPGSTAVSTNFPIDASFNGVAPDYNSDDIFHISIYISDPTQLQDFRIRVYLGGVAGQSTSDYYEKIVIPSGLQPQITSAYSISTVETQASLVTTGVVPGFSIANDQVGQAVPLSLDLSSALTATTPVWSEINIPKSQFLAVGNAGTGNITWKNATAYNVITELISGSTSTPTVSVGSVYFQGGYGPSGLAYNTTLTAPLLPYSYVYTYRNPSTGAESNPSVAMISANAVYPTNQQVAVTCASTADPQITGTGSISVYRSGGSLQDGLYRFVGYATNPGSGSVTFYDTATDESIVDNDLAQFDNDPPVPSTLPVPISATVTLGTSPSAPGSSVTATISLPSGVSTLVGYINPGSLVTISSGGGTAATNFETCVVASVSSNSLTFYCQYAHYTGDTLTCSVCAGAPANIALQALDSVFIAGDPNNPHVLYKSKNGQPESFPALEFSTNIPQQIDVGSPSDPILAITELNSAIICLNLSSIYVVNVFAGSMQAPIRTPASRGVVGSYAWCRADNEIWYVAYDGVYSWSGGQSVKRSEAVDPLFKGSNYSQAAWETFGQYWPIQFGSISALGRTFTGAQAITMSYYQNEIIITYIDSSGVALEQNHRLRYNTIHDRWWIEDIYDELTTSYQTVPHDSPVMMTAQYVEPDTGNLLIAKTFPISGFTYSFLNLDNVGISDGWITSTWDGAPIRYLFCPAAFTLGSPSVNKTFADVVLDLTNDSAPYTLSAYYNYSATVSSDVFSNSGSTGGTGRHRDAWSFNSGYGQEAYAIQLTFSGVFSGTSPVSPATFYSITLNAYGLEQIQNGRTMEWMDLGHPYDKRLYELTLTHDVVTGQTVTLNLDIMTGLNDAQTITNAYQTFTLNPVSGDTGNPHRVTANFPITDGTVVKRVRLRPTVGTVPFKLWMDAQFQFEKYPPDIVPFTEYSTYNHPYDKHLFVLWANIDTNGKNVSCNIEADGAVVQTVTLNGTYNNRSIPVAVNVDIIGKLIRLHQSGSIPSGGKFQLFDHHFDFEKFPADIVLNTEYRDFGYPYLKYLQALVLDINTNNKAVPIQVVGDGNTLQTVTVTSTIQTRDQRFALNITRDGNGVPVPASKVRLVIDPTQIPSGGRVQIWTWDVVHEKADLGPITHSTDWDNMDWPYDKQLQEITFQYDNNSGGPVTMQMDTETGIQGGTITYAAYSFSLNQGTRAIQTFPFPDGVYVKQVRIYPQSDFVSWRNWKYNIKAVNQPADVTEWVDWTNLGWPCEKIARNLILDINTAGVAATITLQADGNTMQTFTVNTTTNARDVVLACNPNLIGRLWRILLSPGSGGATQLFAWNLDYVKEPCAVTFMDTYEQDFGFPGWKFMKTMWLRYTSSANITINFYVEGGTLFYSLTLPANATREFQKFYFPSVSSGVLNKSRTYRITVSSSGTFKIYADSIVEFEAFGEDQIQAFKINPSSPELQLPVASPTVGGQTFKGVSS